jgi:hypothetical protein
VNRVRKAARLSSRRNGITGYFFFSHSSHNNLTVPGACPS